MTPDPIRLFLALWLCILVMAGVIVGFVRFMAWVEDRRDRGRK